MRAKFCPKCGASDVIGVAGYELGLYECKKCKFRGTIFPEKEIKRRLKNKYQ